jgi:hypothetical protein
MKLLRDTPALFSAAELSEVVGIDIETVNNWLRHGVITRASVGGRQLRSRLFSRNEVYKTALTNALVKLGIPPSSASQAVNAVWKAWDKKQAPEAWNVYAVIWPSKDKWTVELCSRESSGGPLYRFGKSTTKFIAELDLPKEAFSVIPVSDILDRVSKNLSELFGDE